MDFTLLIIGADANAYYMARCFHELTNQKAYLIAKNPIWFTDTSKILNISYNDDLREENVLLEVLDKFYYEHKNEKILLISATENYIELIAKNKDKLKDKYYFNYSDIGVIKTLSNKELFYKKYMDNGIIDLPKTIYYNLAKDNNLNIKFDYPVIVKPANVVAYRKICFKNQNKIYKVKSYNELKNVINDIKIGGYLDTLIIQEYIPGDDSTLFDSVVYSNYEKKVKRVTLAQIGLQEHKKDLIGNAAILINGYNQFDDKNIVERIKKLSEIIGITGFCEFDLKYDKRVNDYKLLEINPRQGRSSYYLTSIGCNLVDILKRDLIDHEKLEYELLNKEVLLSFVPKRIIKKYVLNEEYKKKALSLYHNHVNPIKYKKDFSLKRNYLLLKKDLRYFKDFKDGYWENK